MISEYIGGGFGAKQGAGIEALLAAELARATGRPVRLALARHEEQVVGGRRAWTRQTVTLGARSDGTLAGIELAAVVDMGAGGWIFPVAEPALSIYACENVRAMVFPVRTSLRAQNAFRAPGVVEGVTVLEQAMDELAAALGLDPLELRRRNHVDRDQGSRATLLEQAAARLLRPRRRARGLGRARERSASRTPTGCSAGWAARRRSGGAAAGRPRRRRCASTPSARAGHDGIQDIGTGTLTSARRSPPRSSACRSSASSRAEATRGRTSTARSRAAR